MFVLLIFIIIVVNIAPLSHERHEYFEEIVDYVSGGNRADINTILTQQQ